MRKKNKYIPQRISNPVLLQKQLDKLKIELSLHSKNIDAISKSHDNHITMLSNFARHDIKNCVQSMDSIISSNTVNEITEEHINSLKLSLEIIRETVNNFSKLVPYSDKDKFELNDLLIAIELLNRESFYVNKIEFINKCEVGQFLFNLPFQSVLQMLNNIIINAVKAFETASEVKKIKITAEIIEDSVYLKIYDNASKISFNDINSIFNYGISSTGGSGIGLYHAKYLCGLYKGKIEVIELQQNNEFSKYFLISLPLLKNQK